MKTKLEDLRVAVIPTEADHEVTLDSTVDEILNCKYLVLYELIDYFVAQNNSDFDLWNWTFLIDIKNRVNLTKTNYL